MKPSKLFSLIICLAIPLVVAWLGSALTTPSIPTWYAGINKPSFNPPNWLFAPVWTTLFLLMGFSAYLIFSKSRGPKRRQALLIFLAQLALNLLWSFLFFFLHNPLAAFIEIIILWLMILATIISFYRLNRLASYLLWPYLAWVSFASFLNFTIWRLN